jgi:hypothetical protein
MHDREAGAGTSEASYLSAAGRRWAVRPLAVLGAGVGLLLAACALRVTAADAVPAAGNREAAERKDAAAADEMPGAVRIDRAGGWVAVPWASDLNTDAAHLDAAGEHPRYSVEEAGKRGVWLKEVNPPITRRAIR